MKIGSIVLFCKKKLKLSIDCYFVSRSRKEINISKNLFTALSDQNRSKRFLMENKQNKGFGTSAILFPGGVFH